MVLHHLVVEDGEVEGEAEADGVAGRQLDLVCILVVLERIVSNSGDNVLAGILTYVAVVVADHLDEEGLGLTLAGLGEHLVQDHVDDSLAVVVQLTLDLLLVGAEGVTVFLVLGVLLDGGDGAAGSALGADHVLESD